MSKAQRRADLLAAAQRVFAQRGYHAAKVDEIVALANVSKGTFYLYFPDKRSIFEALVDNLFTQLSAAITTVDPAADVETQIKANIRGILAVMLADPALTLIFFSYAAGLDPEFVQKVHSFSAGVMQILEQALRDGQALGIVAPGDPRIFTLFTMGGLKELVLAAALEGRADEAHREQIVDALYQMLEAGFLRVRGL